MPIILNIPPKFAFTNKTKVNEKSTTPNFEVKSDDVKSIKLRKSRGVAKYIYDSKNKIVLNPKWRNVK
jgi:hypothetical protein